MAKPRSSSIRANSDGVVAVSLWYTRLLQVQFVFGALYGILLLIAPIELIEFSVAGAPASASSVSPSAMSRNVLEDFSLWLGAAHLCFAALAYVGLASSSSETIPRSTLLAVALPSLTYFAISAFYIDVRSLFIRKPATWQLVAMVPAMVAEMGFTFGHLMMLRA
eukprot:m.61831 g.61831  ORF g.61831 m.61831 type:complete len:165 (-) comp23042_c1_seq1:245-739(-)